MEMRSTTEGEPGKDAATQVKRGGSATDEGPLMKRVPAAEIGEDTDRGGLAGGAATDQDADRGARGSGAAFSETSAAAAAATRSHDAALCEAVLFEEEAEVTPAASEAGVALANPSAEAAAPTHSDDTTLCEAVLSEALRDVRLTLSRLREEVSEALPGVEAVVPLGRIVDEVALVALTPKLMPLFIEVTRRQVRVVCVEGKTGRA
jgi:hypothetical protein